jgi:hypothetical protein
VKARFLNVDLDIESRSPLDPIVEALGERVDVLYSGPMRRRRFLCLELALFHNKGPDLKILAFCALIEQLPQAARRLWNSASRKEFNIGYDWRSSGHYSQCVLRPDTLRRISDVGASLVVTFYRHDPDLPPRSSTVGSKPKKRGGKTHS